MKSIWVSKNHYLNCIVNCVQSCELIIILLFCAGRNKNDYLKTLQLEGKLCLHDYYINTDVKYKYHEMPKS